MKKPRIFSAGRAFSRRTVLRGAGVALTLPWLESLQAPEARAQSAASRLRFLPIYLPCGAPPRWKPPAFGSGAAWTLSSVLEPLSALKSSVTVLSGLENGSVFNANGSSSVEPSHGRQSGAWLTCVDADEVSSQLGGQQDANGISVDQVIAASAAFRGLTPLESLQVGLSTAESFCDGKPCSHSRSVSWKTPTLPLFKTVNPQEVFDQLMSVGAGNATEEAIKRRANRKSVLDAVKESAGVVRPKLNAHDTLRLDEFLDSVRSVEQRIEGPTVVRECDVLSGPFPVVLEKYRQNSATYNKGTHANAMNDLIAMAFQCDLTRVISYMLEDERSEFVCDHVPRRRFDDLTSTPDVGYCGDWHSAQMGERDHYASIVHWNVGKISQLCQKLATMDDGDGRSVLDNSVVFLGACMNAEWRCADLPSVLIGGGGGALKTDQHLDLGNRPMRDLYITLMNNVLGLNETDFGTNRTGAALKPISELLA